MWPARRPGGQGRHYSAGAYYQPPFVNRPHIELLDGDLERGLFVRCLDPAEERGGEPDEQTALKLAIEQFDLRPVDEWRLILRPR